MTPGKFLRLVWPDRGFYCIAHPFKPAGSAVTVYRHHVFPTISEAVTHVHERANLEDVYFAILSLEQLRVWDPDKTDFKTGELGAWAQRKQENMFAARSLFFDLDVGTEAGKYATQADAKAGLAQFIIATKLPMPTLVSSGGGIHCYWHFDASIPTDEWRQMAWNMRQLAEKLQLLVDPTRTIDSTSVLRVPETWNWKDRQNPRAVVALQEGVITPLATLNQLISDAMITAGVAVTPPPARRNQAAVLYHPELEKQGFNDFGPPPTLSELGDACAQVRRIVRSQADPAQYEPLDNTAWYRGMLATLKHVEGGDALCHKLTNLHPRTVSDTDAKLLQLERFPPAKCETLANFMPWKDAPCQTCRFKDKVKNPFQAARKATPAAPPVVGSVPPSTTPSSPPPSAPTPGAPTPPPLPAGTPTSTAPMQLMAPVNVNAGLVQIPNPPLPFERLKTGQIAITRTDKDGNSTTTVIFQNDLFPLRRLVNKGEVREQQVWRTVLPRSGARDFTIDADVLYDSRKFSAALSNNGLYPNKADIPLLQDYMVAYISQLQKTLDADNQSNHLGWADNYQEFILPDKTLLADGSVKASTLSLGAERAAQFVRKAGDANTQRSLMQFYNKPEYIPNQFVILSSLASILFDMTGHHGIVVNCSGEAGASKSSTLYTAMGLWGDPILWAINGTNRGATANARMQRITTNANLPTGVDEITHMPAREAIDLVMGITQPGHRLRLTTDGVERKVEDSYKSAIMIATANSSLHSLISQDSAAGTAGSMRVFEIKFIAQRVHTKAEADEYLREMKLNYGHLGEIFAQFVVKHRSAIASRLHRVMAEIDAEGRVLSSERFWSAVIAAVYVTAEICQALGLLPYDAEAIRAWAVKEQIPYMRGIVREEYRDPLAILTDFIAERHGNILVVDKATSIGANTSGVAVAGETAFALNQLHGALLGHYDLKTHVLVMLKQAFKDYCTKIGASSSRLLADLAEPRDGRRIILEYKSCRRTLGAGTQLAKGQTYCFAIDMTHPDIAGAAPTVVASSGVATSAPAGNLTAVK